MGGRGGNGAGPGARARVQLTPRASWSRRDTGPEAGKAAEGALWAPTPQSFLLVIHPLPHSLVVFTQFFLFPLLSPVPDCGGGGGTTRGFQVAGWLSWLFKTPDSPSPT